jgi:hypothetical protein
MSDSDQTSTLRPEAPEAPPYVPPRFRDRVLGLRGVIAVALACVVLGGVGGAVLGATTNGGGDRFGGRGGPGAFPGQPGQPGQFRPGQQGPQQGRLPQQGQAPNGG